MTFGQVNRLISDTGGEFVSAPMLQLCEAYNIAKECAPPYANDRLSAIDRSIRTVRESCERSFRGLHGTSPVESLPDEVVDVIVSTAVNAHNNDVGLDGYSASIRQFGRPTNPSVTLLEGNTPALEPHGLARVALHAQRKWQETTNDASFQKLLHSQPCLRRSAG